MPTQSTEGACSRIHLLLPVARGDIDLGQHKMVDRQTYSRRHAFRDELTKALDNLGIRSVS